MNSEERRLIITKLKKQIRKNNWNYLCRHPEIRALVRVVLKAVVKDQPDKIYDFIAQLFSCDTLENLTEEVNEQLKRLNNLIRDDTWNEYAGEFFFSEKSESKYSVKSKQSAVNSILKFSGLVRDDYDTPQSEESFDVNFVNYRSVEKSSQE